MSALEVEQQSFLDEGAEMIRRGPRPERDFTILPNATIRDRELSWQARGLLHYILSMPDHWTVRVDQLVGQATNGYDSVKSTLRELERAGYLTRKQQRDPKTGRMVWEQVVYETPVPTAERTSGGATAKPTDGNPSEGNPPLGATSTDAAKAQVGPIGGFSTAGKPSAVVSTEAARTEGARTEQQGRAAEKHRAAEVEQVFALFKAIRQEIGHPTTIALTPPRWRRISDQIDECGLETVLDAIRGLKHHPWYIEKALYGLEHILRNAERVEEFAGRWRMRDTTVTPLRPARNGGMVRAPAETARQAIAAGFTAEDHRRVFGGLRELEG
jgi:hypothetical protein